MSDLRERVALLPCPFCGKKPVLGTIYHDGGFKPSRDGSTVEHEDDECPACGMHSLDDWNRRSLLPTAPSEAGLREALENLIGHMEDCGHGIVGNLTRGCKKCEAVASARAALAARPADPQAYDQPCDCGRHVDEDEENEEEDEEEDKPKKRKLSLYKK